MRAEELGVQPVHRLRDFNAEGRRKDKLTQKHDWFKPKDKHWKKRLVRKEEELELGIDKGKDEEGGTRPWRSGLGQGQGGVAARPRPNPKDGPKTQGQGPNPMARTECVLFVPHTPEGYWPR